VATTANMKILLVATTICLLVFAATSASAISRNRPLVQPVAKADHLAIKRLANRVTYSWTFVCNLYCRILGGRYSRRCVRNHATTVLAERCPCFCYK
ncbi:hypothetical protein BOX15_Mlig016290g2, partial [Macrostomum lignano]